MPDVRTPEERFEDRLEIVGYLSAILAGIFLVTYFGMIFFYRPVQLHSPGTKLLVLLLSSVALYLGFFIPRYHNASRVAFRLFFLGLAVFAYFRSLAPGQWFFGLLLVYALYALWVLSHPRGLRFFRRLRPYEERVLPIAGWFTLHLVVLTLFALITAMQGLIILSRTGENLLHELDQGMFQLFLSLVVIFFLPFLRRLQNWARWCLALLCAGLGLTAVPATMSVTIQNYLAYWQTLAKVFYFLSVGGYLVFSPAVRRVFDSPAAKPPAAPGTT